MSLIPSVLSCFETNYLNQSGMDKAFLNITAASSVVGLCATVATYSADPASRL